MPGTLSFDDLDLREEPARNSAETPTRSTIGCTTTDVCSDYTCVCQTTRYC
jgi:hypothetical protein